MKALFDKITARSASVGVVGLGYVGLPLAVEKAKAGFSVVGIDVSEDKVKSVNAGRNYIGDVADEDLAQVVASGALRAACDFSAIAQLDCVCICVPTPLDAHQQPNIGFVEGAARAIAEYMHPGLLIILESTTYPGTTQELLKPIFEASGLKCGEDFFLAFSPERVDPGNTQFKTKNTPKVVGGVTENCTKLAAALYRAVLDAPIHAVSSPAVAEMEKILENAYRNINIGLVNELAMLCDRMRISIWEVIDAAKSKPYGFQAFYPGPGLGGHCIPLDPYYLSWKAREFGFHTSMIEASMMINDRMPEYCVERASRILNRFRKALNGAKILILGIAYKQDVDDYRESPALRVIECLKKQQADISFYDPYVTVCQHEGHTLVGHEVLTREIIQAADLVMITTAHQKVDYELVQKHAAFVFDTKNAMKDIENRQNIELL